jgi:hypothetical protein
MNDRNSLLDKIRALMSKTAENGCTEHEALAALDKARALMDAYEVTASSVAWRALSRASVTARCGVGPMDWSSAACNRTANSRLGYSII